MASTPFSVSQENSIRMAAMCCLTVGAAARSCRISIYAATVTLQACDDNVSIASLVLLWSF